MQTLSDDDLGRVTEFAFRLSEQKGLISVLEDLSYSYQREQYLNSDSFETERIDDEDIVQSTVQDELDSAVKKAMEDVGEKGRYAVSVNVYHEPFDEEEEAVSEETDEEIE
jgi:hypothetical protein